LGPWSSANRTLRVPSKPKKGHLRFRRKWPLVEAPGIEPGSRGTSAPASTCVSCLVLAGRNLAAPPTAFARAAPDKQGPARTNRMWSLAVASSGASAPEGTASGDSEPDLATKPKALRRSPRTWGSLYLGRHGKLRFSSYECDRLFRNDYCSLWR
jgi:hypothetical protein